MYYSQEQARTETITASQVIYSAFKHQIKGQLDAEFVTADRRRAVGFAGLPYTAPICTHLLNGDTSAEWLNATDGNILLVKTSKSLKAYAEQGELNLSKAAKQEIEAIYQRVVESRGTLNSKGELTLDLLSYPVGPHYPVNLLLGNREGYSYPLCTTPKGAVDALGHGSFRATGGTQVLATRCVLPLEENGEPENRQFYITENGHELFYSADVHHNVVSAECVHGVNYTRITYHTEDRLEIIRTIFILPQQDDMPTAVEAQRVEVVSHGSRTRRLRIVFTGMFGIAGPITVANDDVYANIVQESEVYYNNGKPTAMTLHAKPWEERTQKRFALVLSDGQPMEEFCTSRADFIGSGSLSEPEQIAHLSNRSSRKNTPFFAMAKSFTAKKETPVFIDSYAGMMETAEDVTVPFDSALHAMVEKYSDPQALADTFAGMQNFWSSYTSYLTPKVKDPKFTAYVSHNLPFQVLYQTYVSRAFAWTQKSYRETGFREIQDIYASMYYLSANGQNALIKDLLGNWIHQVFRMGYAYHDFTFQGKEPGDCSDDQLWLVQAVYRYVKLTGDTDFLEEEYEIAGEDGKRPLWDTLMNILTYSGKISVGAHGLPLLDKADWNDTLRLDKVVLKGPAKEKKYRAQLKRKHQQYGAPYENTDSESVMNACLLKIAADEVSELAELINQKKDGRDAHAMAERIEQSVQKNAWKNGYFARCLINDHRPGGYTYLGAAGDGLQLEDDMPGTFYLNSYSWPILAGIATETELGSMLDIVEKYLKTDAGLKLCTLVQYDRLGVNAGTSLYFPGDRENGGVFKHAAMMATVASLQAAKTVNNEDLAERLRNLAFFMISRTLPYRAMENPFVLKGNPRFCTQYNNSETGENVGPMLSGTASWLTLAVYEFLGISRGSHTLTLNPIMISGKKTMSYDLKIEDIRISVTVDASSGRFRTNSHTVYELDGRKCGNTIKLPKTGSHQVVIKL